MSMLYRVCTWYLVVLAMYIYIKRKKKGKKKRKNVATKSNESKERRKRSPTNNFLVGNYGLRRAKRRENMPSMSSEVGEI